MMAGRVPNTSLAFPWRWVLRLLADTNRLQINQLNHLLHLCLPLACDVSLTRRDFVILPSCSFPLAFVRRASNPHSAPSLSAATRASRGLRRHLSLATSSCLPISRHCCNASLHSACFLCFSRHDPASSLQHHDSPSRDALQILKPSSIHESISTFFPLTDLSPRTAANTIISRPSSSISTKTPLPSRCGSRIAGTPRPPGSYPYVTCCYRRLRWWW
jgi:hypothetical protein